MHHHELSCVLVFKSILRIYYPQSAVRIFLISSSKGIFSSNANTLRNREEVFGNAAAVEENKRLRERMAHMSMEGATLRKKVVPAQDDAEAKIERFQHLLERMYRDSIREMKDRIFSDILEGMNDSAKELVRDTHSVTVLAYDRLVAGLYNWLLDFRMLRSKLVGAVFTTVPQPEVQH